MMHIYSMQVGESVRIGDEVTATVVAIKGGQIRLGISARAELPIHREELVEHCGDVGWPKPKEPDATEVESEAGMPKQGPRDSLSPETDEPGIS